MEKIINYFEKALKVACDEKCHKAWGISNRPTIDFDPDDPDDCAFISDLELGDAPIDPGTYEGGQAKPVTSTEIPNKWCVRECERCWKSRDTSLEPDLTDFSKRVYNQPWKHDIH